MLPSTTHLLALLALLEAKGDATVRRAAIKPPSPAFAPHCITPLPAEVLDFCREVDECTIFPAGLRFARHSLKDCLDSGRAGERYVQLATTTQTGLYLLRARDNAVCFGFPFGCEWDRLPPHVVARSFVLWLEQVIAESMDD